MLRKKIGLSSLLGLAMLGANGQNNTTSPFSRYGYGQLVDVASSRGMCGLSVGTNHRQYVNYGNPATYTAIDSLNFRFEVGAALQWSMYNEGDAQNSNLSGNLELVAMQFPIMKWMGFALGMAPFSVVGYEYISSKSDVSDVDGETLKYTNEYSGTGGINEVFFGLGFRPFKPFTIGINGKFLFGTVETSSKVDFEEATNSAFYHNTMQTSSNKIRDFRFDIGAQYEIGMREEKSLVIGVTFEPKSELNADAEKTTTTTRVDTTTVTYDSDFDLPMSWGFGASYVVKNKLVVGVDYRLQMWSDARYYGEKNFEDRHKIIVGAEFLPDYMSKKYMRRVSYRLGFSTANTYYKVCGETMMQNVLSVGFGFPLKRGLNPTIINFNIDYGFNAMNNTDIDVMEENYLKFTLTATINERWFVRRRLE